MSVSKLSTRFVIFVIVSLMTHLMELAASGLFCYMLIQHTDLRMPWFSLAAGLLILPMVAVQLASAVFFLRRKTGASTTWEVVTAAALHVFQLGFISRHFIILKEAPLSSKRTEVMEMMMLRLTFAFASGCTLLLMQVYLLLQGCHQQSLSWVMYLSGTTTLISITWGVSTFRRCLLDSDFGILLISWPGTVLRFFWRAGEILARIIAAGLFASLYTRFLILVIGLHWISMLACLHIPPITSIEWSTTSYVKRTLICFIISFSHIFVFINTSSENSVFRYTFYFVIFFLENSTLVAVWFVQSSTEQFYRNNVYAYISAIVFVVSLTSVIIYYKFFHSVTFTATTAVSCDNYPCVACNHEETSSFHSVFPRRGAKGNWQTHSVPESLLESDLNSASSSQAYHHKSLHNVEDGLRENNSHHTKTRQDRINIFTLSLSNTEENKSSINRTDIKIRSEDISSASTEPKCSSTKVDTGLAIYKKPHKTPVWLPSGDSTFASQLLSCSLNNFDASETADSDRSSITSGCSGYQNNHSSSPVDHAASPMKIGTINTQADSSVHKIHDNNPFPDSCTFEVKSNPQRQPLMSLMPISWTNLSDSENERTTYCEFTHGIPELSPEHPVTKLSQSDLKSLDVTTNQCHHNTNSNYFNHHQNGLHNNVHHSVTPSHSSRFLQKEVNQNIPTNIPKSVQETSPMVTGHVILSNCKREQNTSSLGSTSNNTSNQQCYPHTRKDEFTSVDTITPHSLKDQHNNVKSIRLEGSFSSKKDTDILLAESDRLAVELLKPIIHSDTSILKEKSELTTQSATDPRLTIRVMTSNIQESSSLFHEINENQQPNVEILYNLTEVAEKFQESWSPEGKQSDSREGKFHLVKASDEIYECLWPSKQLKPIEYMKSYRPDTSAITDRTNRRDLYVCSESEDSALPHEVLSTSAEGFTASDNESDISLEIVI